MKRVLLCQDIHPEGRRVLEGHVEIVVAPDPREETVRAIIGGFHGVVVRTATRLGRETIRAATALEVIGRTGAGVDNIDVDAATRRGIPVCYTPEANSSSVVEHVLALILGLAKQLSQMDQAVREGRFGVRYDYRAVDVAGKTVGVVGLGRIGRGVARRCRDALDMTVIAYDPYVEAQQIPSPEKGTGPFCAKHPSGLSGKRGLSPFPAPLPQRERGVAVGGPPIELASDLATVFERGDFVTLHVPYSQATHHLVNAELIAKMQPSSYLVNTSRGAVVDETALARALAEGRIAGAALDVFEKEPPDPDNPLLKLPNVILTPHSAALTRECVARMAVDAAQGVLDVLEGRKPKYVFNPEPPR